MTRLFKVLAAAAIAMPMVSLAYQLEINGHIYNNESGVPLSVEQVTVEQVQGKIIINTLPGSTAKVCYANCSSGPANQAPNITTTTMSNTAGTTTVGTVQATDPDAGTSLTFSLAGGANANLFSITSSGVLSFLTASTQGTYVVNVKVEDNGSGPLSDTQAITVSVGAVGSCGTTPQGVTVIPSNVYSINWAQTKADTLLPVDNADTASIPVHTTTGAHKGFIRFAEDALTPGVERTLWISECPGTIALPGAGPCSVTGVSNKKVRWNQGSAASYECQLQQNTDYYINVQNTNCTSSSCNVYVGFTTD